MKLTPNSWIIRRHDSAIEIRVDNITQFIPGNAENLRVKISIDLGLFLADEHHSEIDLRLSGSNIKRYKFVRRKLQ